MHVFRYNGTMKQRTYAAIDLKSFYASVECVERGLDPLKSNLVVADLSRTEKTICLAVSPALKKYGIAGRARLYEVIERVKEINALRKRDNHYREFRSLSVNSDELNSDASLELGYLTAVPRMQFYLEYSTRIYGIYLRWIAPEDIHVYSIDEVFLDLTEYLHTYNMTARELVERMIHDVLKETGITATAGIGTNLYLCKVAMDIVAKHMEEDEHGVRIAELDERSYREQLWAHEPLTDFWRVGPGYSRRLKEHGMYTMGDIARQSLLDNTVLYRLFGINAELLIDHAWGYESCTMRDIKAYVPESKSCGIGQVLMEPYSFEKGRIIVHEMADQLALDLVEKGYVTDRVVLGIGYDTSSLTEDYHGEIKTNYYGKKVPKSVHGTAELPLYTSAGSLIREGLLSLYDGLVNPELTIRRVGVTAINIRDAAHAGRKQEYRQTDLFSDAEADLLAEKELLERTAREKKAQEAFLEIQRRFGKNAVIKGVSLEEGATGRQRNKQIGGHKA